MITLFRDWSEFMTTYGLKFLVFFLSLCLSRWFLLETSLPWHATVYTCVYQFPPRQHVFNFETNFPKDNVYLIFKRRISYSLWNLSITGLHRTVGLAWLTAWVPPGCCKLSSQSEELAWLERVNHSRPCLLVSVRESSSKQASFHTPRHMPQKTCRLIKNGFSWD